MPGLVLPRPAAPILALLAAVAATLAMLLATPTPASAHDDLVASAPAAGEQLASPPTQVTLTFSDAVGQQFAQVAVVDGAGTAFQTGDPVVSGATITQAVAGLSPGGAFTISYRVVSSDGHPIGGTVPFTVAGPAPTAAPAPAPTRDSGSEPSPDGAAASATPALIATPPATPEAVDPTAGTTSSSPLPWLLAAVALLAAATAGVVLARRRRPSDPDLPA
jgi:methionine-rich copper-binding protein CopC